MAEIRPSRIQVNIEDLSTKQKNVILSIINDIEFTPMEISELVIEMGVNEESVENEEKQDE